jgi:hypothetical protein
LDGGSDDQSVRESVSQLVSQSVSYTLQSSSTWWYFILNSKNIICELTLPLTTAINPCSIMVSDVNSSECTIEPTIMKLVVYAF